MTGLDLTPLRSAWARQARRIDALSLRERAVLLLCVAAVLAALFDTLLLSPLAARASRRAAEQDRQAAELAQLRAQFVGASQGAGGEPAGAQRAAVQAAQAERVRLDAELRRLGTAGGGEGLSALLQRLLARQPGLVLERLTLLDDDEPAAPRVPGVGWQGVALQVRGRYADLQRHVQALERELPGLRWGELRLSAPGGGEPARLQAELFVLKVQP
ncbi:MAG: hypothetical protein QM788_15395 [Roseateles sp.]|uniref:hypothetical protein n=1 Tax=Roseateles sp. TaxID=1971397 RepID=UPI0039EB36B0